MKQFSILATLLLAIFWSCSSDDGDTQAPSKNYLPIAQGNTWHYDFAVTTALSGASGKDTTFMGGTTDIDGKLFNEWVNVQHLFGFSNEVLANKTGANTYIKIPDIDLGFGDPVALPYVKIIEDGSSAGTVLDSFEVDQLFDAIPIPDTLDFSGTIRPHVYIKGNSVHANTFSQLTLNGADNYTDVYKNESNFKIQVDFIADLTYQGVSGTITHTWIPEQDYTDLSVWFANDIGIARSEIVSGINQVDNTVDVPLIGEIDLEDFGITADALLDVTNFQSVAELTTYELD